EGVGATAAALVDLSTVAGNKISNPPWVKFQSAGWVNFPSAPTHHFLYLLQGGALLNGCQHHPHRGVCSWAFYAGREGGDLGFRDFVHGCLNR
ncbi:hypothetical protein ACYKDZ_17840, partial [Stutzerimonas stutzeri]